MKSLLNNNYRRSANGRTKSPLLAARITRWATLPIAAAVLGFLPESAQSDTVTGVTIEDVSTELLGGFDRPGIYVIDGSGFDEANGFHSSAPDGVSWLSNGTFTAPNDPNIPGAVITFDLEGNYDLDSFKVWNYNEVNLPTRGANEVEILVASSEGGAFTSLGNFNFTIAPGADGVDFGQVIDLSSFAAANNTRLVRFNILSSHGGDNNFAGLSEVRFDAVPAGIVVFPAIISSAASQGTAVGTLSTPPGDAGDTFTYAFIAGEGDTDNGKFQIAGDELQAGSHDFSTATDGQQFSIRILSTGSPSGETFEAALVVTAEANSDADDLPDAYELQWAGNLTTLSGLNGADADNDGLSDLEEFNLAGDFPDLDPTMADTDSDTLNDGDEIAGAGLRPVTDPTIADTDEDGLSDGVETNTGTFVSASDTGTDPTVADTDEDGRSDANEVANGSDPTNPDSLPGVGLVGLWTFDGDTLDSSGNENHGTLENGATLSDDVPALIGGGQSVSVGGGEEHVLVPHDPSLNLTAGITISAWIKPADTSWAGIIAKNPQDGGALNHAGNYELRLNQNELNPSWLYETGGLNTTLTLNDTSTSVPVGEWTHLALTMDSSNTYTFYVNGAPTASETRGEAFGTSVNSNPLYIGSRADLFTTTNGLIDEVLLFDDALVESQILALMGGDYSDFGVGSSQFAITEVVYDAVAPSTTFTFTSRPSRSYAVDFSTDLNLWNELDDGVQSQGGETTFVDTLVAGSAPTIYYRVREL